MTKHFIESLHGVVNRDDARRLDNNSRDNWDDTALQILIISFMRKFL